MRRSVGWPLVAGCALVLALELPSAWRSLRRDLGGPYAAWQPGSEELTWKIRAPHPGPVTVAAPAVAPAELTPSDLLVASGALVD